MRNWHRERFSRERPSRERFDRQRLTRGSHREDRTNTERGSVTAEVAIVMPVVVGFLVLAITAGSAVWQHGRCAEAARSAARAASVGETSEVIELIVAQIAGPEARVSTGGSGDLVEIVVSRDVALIGPVSASVIARREPGSR